MTDKTLMILSPQLCYADFCNSIWYGQRTNLYMKTLRVSIMRMNNELLCCT